MTSAPGDGGGAASRESPKRRPLTIAHRGARSVAPENTLASFRRAVQLGADALECDVHLTRDGVPVVFHDFTLERCTDFAERARGSGQRLSPFLGDWTLEELSRLDAGSWYGKTDPFGQVKAGRVGPAELDSFRGERIPTLQEVLDLCREAGVGLVLEIKQGARPSEELVRRAVDQVRAGRMLDGTALISFDHPSLLLARRMEPSLAVGALLVERLADPGRYAREVLGARLVSVYCPEGVFTRCAPEDSYLAEDARLAHEAGVAYHVWTANAPEDLHGLMRAGVDGIATDFPQRLVEALGRGSPARGLVLRAPEQL